MRKIFLFLVLSIFALNLNANPIDQQTALLVAKNFFSTTLKKLSTNLTLVYECKYQKQNNGNLKQAEDLVYYYVYNSENGFIIISGDDAVLPILGYSTSGTFDPNNQPDNFKKWLENYKNQIRFVITNNIKPTKVIEEEWKSILENRKILKNTKAVNKLLNTTWGQSPYVNAMCPYDINAGASNQYHCVTGCPATAMAQIMKYWNYPANGTGFHQYTHETYGLLSANFGSTNYDWASMPNVVSGANNAVATLMYHCGVSVEMQYGPTSSGSYVIIDGYPEKQTSEYAYKTYFGYDPTTLKGLRRANYSDNDWKQLLKSDLDAGRPIQYAGFGQGGHTFVCDGYDNNDYFHMNWGWSGYADGYFLLDALNPGSGGTGSGAGTYNNEQQAIVGIKPLSGSISYNLALYDNLTVTPTSIIYGQGFTVHTDIVNAGTNSFSGDYGAAIFDNEYNFIDFVEIKTGYSLQSNYHYTNGLDFTTTGILAVLPGTYHIALFYRPTGGNWKIVNNGSYSNICQLVVSNSNEIALFSNITVNTGDITQNQSFNVNVDIANLGSTNFSGSFSINLYNLEDGSFVTNIGTKAGMSLPINSHYTNGLTFSSSGISVEPGTYLLAVLHQPDGQNQILTGSQNYTNPVKVIVKSAPLQPDTYEDNNTQTVAYNLPISFTNNSATYLTSGSNNHNGSDLDYYKIVLPAGYNYTLTVRTHDSFNSGNGQIYTNDVAWSYLYNGNWSDVYDDTMPNSIIISNGGTVIFNVSPYFIGSTGTYLLDISISRTINTGIEDIDEPSLVSVYPNPTSDYLNIETTNSDNIQNIELFDVSGKLIYSNILSNRISKFTIPTSIYDTGIYSLKISLNNKIVHKKIIISR